MNIEAVRAFVAVAEEGQFQRAADQLDVSQQAISKRIAALEAELGTALFKRTPSGAALTQDGRTFLPHAAEILSAVRNAFASVQPGTRPLRVDVMARGSGAADLLRDFCQEHPEVSVEMIIGGSAASTCQSLLAGEIDAGYAYLRDVPGEIDPRLARTYARLEPSHVIVGLRHPLAKSRSVRPEELARYRAWVPASSKAANGRPSSRTSPRTSASKSTRPATRSAPNRSSTPSRCPARSSRSSANEPDRLARQPGACPPSPRRPGSAVPVVADLAQRHAARRRQAPHQSREAVLRTAGEHRPGLGCRVRRETTSLTASKLKDGFPHRDVENHRPSS